MKRSVLLLGTAIYGVMSAFASGAALSQTIYPQAGLDNHGQPQRRQVATSYGGGFIEFLMTGNEPAIAPHAPGAPRDRYPSAYPGQPVDLSYDPAQDELSLNRPGRANPGVSGAEGSLYPHQRQRLAYAPAAVAPVGPGELPPIYRRQVVDYDGGQSAGTIVIDTPNKFLYLVEGDGKAMRYGIGVGRPGFEWAGVKSITRKAEWPGWTPPSEMLKRRPDLPRHMEGGPANPLGARAMYLGSSLYRIHGTNEPETIGHNVSSGCIRLTNEDVIDLYGRVSVGAKVIVR